MAVQAAITNFRTTLAQGMTSTQLTMILSSVTVQGHAITSADYGAVIFFTINPGASNMEVVRATANSSTTWTLDKRGLAWYGSTDDELTAFKFNHNASEPVIASNVKNWYELFVDLVQNQNVGGVKTFTLSPLVPTPTSSELQAAASVAYANALAIAGAPDASTTVKGIVEIATQSELNAGTDTGGTGALLSPLPSNVAVAVQGAKYTFAADAQASDTYVITLVPAPAAYVTGEVVCFTVNTANTGAATLNKNGLGAKTIKKNKSQDLETGDFVAGMYIICGFDGTNYQFLGQQASMPSTTILNAAAAFFATTATQSLATTFTAGEALAAGDLVGISAADTVKRSNPSALPTSFDQSVALAGTLTYISDIPRCTFINLTTSLKAFIYDEAVGGTPQDFVVRIPVTPTTGAIGTMSSGSDITTPVITPLYNDAVKMDATRVLICTGKVDSFSAGILDLTSTITAGTTAVLETTNVTDGSCDYISDSHVLFFSRDTSAGSVQFNKLTASGTTLSASSTGTVTTPGFTFTLQGVRRFLGTDLFLIVVQNSTAGSAQAAVATYNEGSSTFTAVSSFVSFPGSIDIAGGSSEGSNVAFAQLSATQMMLAFPQSTTNVTALLCTISGTTPSFGTAQSTTRTANSGYSLTAANSRSAYLSTTVTTTQTIKLLEVNAAGTDIATTASASGLLSIKSGGVGAGFAMSPVRLGGFVLNNSDDANAGSGLYTLFPIAGIAQSTVSAAASVNVKTAGYDNTVSGLTAANNYFADIGGLLTTTSDGTPDKVGVSKDTDEIILGT